MQIRPPSHTFSIIYHTSSTTNNYHNYKISFQYQSKIFQVWLAALHADDKRSFLLRCTRSSTCARPIRPNSLAMPHISPLTRTPGPIGEKEIAKAREREWKERTRRELEATNERVRRHRFEGPEAADTGKLGRHISAPDPFAVST